MNLKSVFCIFGHRWKTFGANRSKAVGLSHLHPQAGMLDLCTRCGKVWDDTLYGFGADDLEFRHRRLIWRAQVRDYAKAHGLRPKGDME